MLNPIAVTRPAALTVAIPTATVDDPDTKVGSVTVIVGAVAYPNPEEAIDTDPGTTDKLDAVPVGAEYVTVGAVL